MEAGEPRDVPIIRPRDRHRAAFAHGGHGPVGTDVDVPQRMGTGCHQPALCPACLRQQQQEPAERGREEADTRIRRVSRERGHGEAGPPGLQHAPAVVRAPRSVRDEVCSRRGRLKRPVVVIGLVVGLTVEAHAGIEVGLALGRLRHGAVAPLLVLRDFLVHGAHAVPEVSRARWDRRGRRGRRPQDRTAGSPLRDRGDDAPSASRPDEDRAPEGDALVRRVVVGVGVGEGAGVPCGQLHAVAASRHHVDGVLGTEDGGAGVAEGGHRAVGAVEAGHRVGEAPIEGVGIAEHAGDGPRLIRRDGARGLPGRRGRPRCARVNGWRGGMRWTLGRARRWTASDQEQEQEREQERPDGTVAHRLLPSVRDNTPAAGVTTMLLPRLGHARHHRRARLRVHSFPPRRHELRKGPPVPRLRTGSRPRGADERGRHGMAWLHSPAGVAALHARRIIA